MPDIGIIPELCNVLDISISTLLNGEETEDEKIILWLASKIKILKNNVKMLCVICLGLVLCNLPNVLSEFVIISDFLETNTFQSGILNGVFPSPLLLFHLPALLHTVTSSHTLHCTHKSTLP